MPRILIYNNDTGGIETYYRSLNDSMPYNTGKTLSVKEFRGSSNSDTLWTTKDTMMSWNQMRKIWGAPIDVGFAFKRIWEKGHGPFSQHYTGTAFDVAQEMTSDQREVLRDLAISSDIWSYVEPAFLTPTWVHFDKRLFPPACDKGGYPLVKLGDKNNYVMTLQDALISLGYLSGPIDGVFGNKTKQAVISYQKEKKLLPDGIVGCATWQSITNTIYNS